MPRMRRRAGADAQWQPPPEWFASPPAGQAVTGIGEIEQSDFGADLVRQAGNVALIDRLVYRLAHEVVCKRVDRLFLHLPVEEDPSVERRVQERAGLICAASEHAGNDDWRDTVTNDRGGVERATRRCVERCSSRLNALVDRTRKR